MIFFPVIAHSEKNILAWFVVSWFSRGLFVFLVVCLFYPPMAHFAVICTIGTRWSELSICPYWSNLLGFDVWQSGSSERFCCLLPSPAGWDVVRSCGVLRGARAEYSLLFPLQEGRTLHHPFSWNTLLLLACLHTGWGWGRGNTSVFPSIFNSTYFVLGAARYTRTILGQEMKIKGLFSSSVARKENSASIKRGQKSVLLSRLSFSWDR